MTAGLLATMVCDERIRRTVDLRIWGTGGERKEALGEVGERGIAQCEM